MNTHASYPDVAGHCPACGGTSLFLADGGYITCSRSSCRRPDAATDLLDDSETQHIVQFGAAEFTIRHPLIERLDDALMDCQLHADLVARPGPPVKPGRYRAHAMVNGLWSWEPVK